MRKFGIILDYFVTGMGFGAIAYLCILTCITPGTAPTAKEVFPILGLSGLIGLLTMIFRTDLPLVGAITIHLVGTFLAFVLMSLVNHWTIRPVSLGIFCIVYVVIWLVIILEQKRNIKQINARIKIRRTSQKEKS